MSDDDDLIGVDAEGQAHYAYPGDNPKRHYASMLCGCNPDAASDDTLDATSEVTWWWNHHDLTPMEKRDGEA